MQEFEQNLSSRRHDDLQSQIENLQSQIERMQWPVASIQDARKILQKCNGSYMPNKQGLTKLESKLAEIQKRMPESSRTGLGWLERHKKGTL